MVNLTFKRNGKEVLLSFLTLEDAFTNIRTEYMKRPIFTGELMKIHSDNPSEARLIAARVNAMQQKEKISGKLTANQIDQIIAQTNS